MPENNIVCPPLSSLHKEHHSAHPTKLGRRPTSRSNSRSVYDAHREAVGRGSGTGYQATPLRTSQTQKTLPGLRSTDSHRSYLHIVSDFYFQIQSRTDPYWPHNISSLLEGLYVSLAWLHPRNEVMCAGMAWLHSRNEVMGGAAMLVKWNEIPGGPFA